jgi:hypothetical protein
VSTPLAAPDKRMATTGTHCVHIASLPWLCCSTSLPRVRELHQVGVHACELACHKTVANHAPEHFRLHGLTRVTRYLRLDVEVVMCIACMLGPGIQS